MIFWPLHGEPGVIGFHRGFCHSGFDDPPHQTSPKNIWMLKSVLEG
jgi:hypothetical protein